MFVAGLIRMHCDLIDIRNYRVGLPPTDSFHGFDVCAVDQIPSSEGWVPIQDVSFSRGMPIWSGKFAEKNSWNIPGPFYGACTDTCATGPAEAPANVMLDFEGQEFLFRQPANEQELRRVICAAMVDPFEGYGADGDENWTLGSIRNWWRERDRLFSLLDDLKNTNQDVEAWVRFMALLAESYLRQYAYFVEERKLPGDSDLLPNL
jgi:hypothetical protein